MMQKGDEGLEMVFVPYDAERIRKLGGGSDFFLIMQKEDESA
jgi:hypothetical protein